MSPPTVKRADLTSGDEWSMDRLGWSPRRPSAVRALGTELFPVLWRGGLVVAAVAVGVGALVHRAFAQLDALVEDQYQVQQATVARETRDRYLARLDGVENLLRAVASEGPSALDEAWFATPVAVTRRIYRMGDGAALVPILGPAPAMEPDEPISSAADWLMVHVRMGSEPAVLCIGVPSGTGWVVGEVDLALLQAETAGKVDRYMSGYPWVIDGGGRLVAAPNVPDLGTQVFADLDAPAYAGFQRVLARMKGTTGPLTDTYTWPTGGLQQRRLLASTTGMFLGEKLIFAVSADADDVTRLAHEEAQTLISLGLLLAAGVGAVGPIALGIQVRSRQRERRAVQRSIASLARAMEARDPYTRGHSENVAYYAARLADCMGHPPEIVARVYTGGLLHDLGKIGVPDALLHKAGRLEPDEMARMRAHPCVGHRILSDLESLRDVVPVVRHHHERMDGTGYPDGLVGFAIPLEARIVAVADVLDALTTDRPYRAGLALPEALRIMGEMRGSHLDPIFVDGLSAHISTIWDPQRVAVPAAS